MKKTIPIKNISGLKSLTFNKNSDPKKVTKTLRFKIKGMMVGFVIFFIDS